MMLFAGNCLGGTHLTFENVNLVTESFKKDGTNLKYFEIKLQDTGELFIFLTLTFYFRGVF